ncbi:MAG: hypothetical protein O6913_04350, partial [Chloroflexi bacterium]|nr:hypothetical protein [Chloroflexota bacterium]
GGFLAVASGAVLYIWWTVDSGWIGVVLDARQFEESTSIPEIPPYPLGVELLAAITAVTSALFAWPTAWLVWRLTARQEDRRRETHTDRRMDEVWRLRSLGLIDETERHRLERAIRSNAPAR